MAGKPSEGGCGTLAGQEWHSPRNHAKSTGPRSTRSVVRIHWGALKPCRIRDRNRRTSIDFDKQRLLVAARGMLRRAARLPPWASTECDDLRFQLASHPGSTAASVPLGAKRTVRGAA